METGPAKKDISDAIELTVRSEQGEQKEINFLKSVVHFGDVAVKQIMKNRVDVVSADFRVSFSELRKMISESGYSRIPIYNDDFDNITGILYAKGSASKP